MNKPYNTKLLGEALRPGRVEEVAVYRGAHRYSRTPMIRIKADIGDWERFPTDLIAGFGTRLFDALPSLDEHGCSYGTRGGFRKRVEEGTWLGHVIEHVALELQHVAGASVSRGKTRSVPGRFGVYNIMYEYQEEEVGLLAGRFAVQLVLALLPIELRDLGGLDLIATSPLAHFGLAEAVDCLKSMRGDLALGPTTGALVREALARGIPCTRLDNSSLVQLGYGKNQKRIRASCTALTSEIAAEVASDKELTSTLLRSSGIPVPESSLVETPAEAVEAARTLGFPVVLKPLDGNHGRGVNIGVNNADEVLWAFEQARAHSDVVIVEQQFSGRDNRVLVVDGKVVAVAERVPAHVTGDGRRTLAELIEIENQDPRRGLGHEAALTKIAIDECLVHYIGRSGLTLGSVPAEGDVVYLRPTANISTGGTAIDRTGDIHPENAFIAERAARLVGLDIAGIDMVVPDIARSALETGGGIIEVNAGPGFRMHLEPSEGRARNVAAAVLDMLFPDGSESRIPVFAVTGSNGKTTTARMLRHILEHVYGCVGLTTTTGIYLGNHRIMSGDCTGPRSARAVLADPMVDAAVLETARGGILREGLGFDRCGVGCVLNVSEDHLGLKDINTVEDLAEVKAVVVEAVQDSGWSVLNADDELTAAMRNDAGGKLCFFTLRSRETWPDFLSEHVAAGGRVASIRTDGGRQEMVIYDHGLIYPVLSVADIPAAFGGLARFNVENALAAAAMAFCGGVNLADIRRALSTFSTSFEQSPGRLNSSERHGFRVIVDYAHNPTGLKAAGQMVSGLRSQYEHCLGVIGIAGDRRDEDIREMGRIAGSLFDKLVLKEDDDRRGRAAGEVANLLRQGALEAGLAPANIEIVLSELEAVKHTMRQCRPGDLLFIAADAVEAVWHSVEGWVPDSQSVDA